MKRRLPIKELVKYYCRAKTAYSSQSVRLFNWYEGVIQDSLGRVNEQHYFQLKKARSLWLNSEESIIRTDYGSSSYNGQRQSVRSIVRNQVSSDHDLAILYHASRYLQPHRTLEFGTSLGLSSSSMALGYEKQKIDTVEADPEIARLAATTHNFLELTQIQICNKTIQDYLSTVLTGEDQFDLVFLDGHHDEAATKAYFHQIKAHISGSGVVIVHDVFWSQGMFNAWSEIRQDPLVKASLLYGQIGFLFFSEKFVEVIHEDWIHVRWKPWTKLASW